MSDERRAPAERPAREEATGGDAVRNENPGGDAVRNENPGGLRLIGAIVTLPWLLLYGVTGVWAVTLAAKSASEGLKRFDAGYTRYVTPGWLAFVGVLLVVAFAVMLACALLLLFRRRSVVAWLALLLVASGLTAGALWAGIQGRMHPLLWAFLFFGLVYVVAVAAAQVLQVTRTERWGTVARP
jgi:multisubunit Na+/H+ antiporter MnhG subunit